MGDVPGLVSQFPVRHLVDHGPATTGGKDIELRYKGYAELFSRIDHIVVKPGDRIPLKCVKVQVLTNG